MIKNRTNLINFIIILSLIILLNIGGITAVDVGQLCLANGCPYSNNVSNTTNDTTQIQVNTLWNQSYDSGQGDQTTSIGLDNSGNVYVTGTSGTIKYDSNGNYLGNSNYTEKNPKVAIDEMSNVYSVSYIQTYYGEAIITKYNSNGTLLWNVSHKGTLRYNSYEDVYPKAIALDKFGNAYVTGIEVYETDNNPHFMMFTIKYDSDGNLLWDKNYILNRHNSGANAIAVDNFGSAYITGYRITNTDEYYTIKYDSNGNEVWNISYKTGNDNQADANAIAVDNLGGIYVTGYRSNGKNNDYFTIKYQDLNSVCTPTLVNVTLNDWNNIGNCSIQNLQNQSKYYMEYDEYNCGNFTNQTFYDYRQVYCDYCSENIQTWYSQWSSCSSGQQDRTKYFIDANHNNCCDITVLDSDCHINNGSYSNSTEYQVCDTPSIYGGSSGGSGGSGSSGGSYTGSGGNKNHPLSNNSSSNRNSTYEINNQTKVICNGCMLNNTCVLIGYINQGKYCDINSKFMIQNKAGLKCQNNFECESNLCINNQCISGSLFQKIIDWFIKYFGK